MRPSYDIIKTPIANAFYLKQTCTTINLFYKIAPKYSTPTARKRYL